MSMQHVQYMLLFLVLAVESNWFQIYGVTHSGVAKAQPKFVLLMCVLLVQWLSVQQVPGQYQWPGYATGYMLLLLD